MELVSFSSSLSFSVEKSKSTEEEKEGLIATPER